MSFAQGMAHEHAISSAKNAAVTPESVAQARAGVMERGRAQSGEAS
jgi:hypothetical protein